MSDINTPTDWMNLPDWDRYWSEVLADEYWKSANMETWSFEHTSLEYLSAVKRRENHRVLLAGNGISPEPYGFAHAGCDVTVVDGSAVACRFLRSMQVTPDLLAHMFTVYDQVMDPNMRIRVSRRSPEKSLKLVDAEYRPGGCVSIITADLFNYKPRQPFDAVFSRRAYQGLPLDRREELSRRFYRWLRPDGFALVETLNIRERESFEKPFRAAGFREVDGWYQRDRVEREVLFWHGSG